MNITALTIIIFVTLVIIGLLTIIKVKQSQGQEQRPGQGQAMGKGIGIGLAIGMPIGLAIGIAMDNIAIGISLGPALGMGIGTAIGSQMEAKRRAEGETDPQKSDALQRNSTVVGLFILALGLVLFGLFYFLIR